MSLNGTLHVAASGLAVTALGVRTAGHNIANVDTPNYSRQRQVIAAETPAPYGNGQLGSGVTQLSITRVIDPFMQQQLLASDSSLGGTQAQASALELVEGVLADRASGGVGSALTQLYDAFSDLAASATPGAPLERAEVRSAAQNLIDTLHTLDGFLRDEMQAANGQIEASLPRVNELLTGIRDLNEQIARSALSGSPANDLMDQRDTLLRELAGFVDIRVQDGNAGRIDVTLANGVGLVEGNLVRTLVAVADPNNPFDPRFARIGLQNGANVSDITAQIGGGSLGGLLRARDVHIAGAVRGLDTIAFNVAARVNAVHASGAGANGAVGDFFAQPATVEDAARDLALAPAILASPDAIAAGLTSAPGDNRNAQALAALRDARAPMHVLGDTLGAPSGPTRSVLEQFASLVTDVGVQVRGMSSVRTTQERIRETLENRRDEISGVSLDEEVTHLVELQAAFQANARVISLVDRLLEDVVNMI